MNRLELRKLSLEFRRLSSNLLNSTDDTADINLSRFLKFIDGNELISGIIQDKISGVDYDFKECYDIGSDDWADYTPPVDEACHIKAQYDYLNFINNENTVNVRSQAMNYCWSDKKINTIIQNFLDMAFKPLIDFINDQLSMEMIVYDEKAKAMGGNTYIQNIETVNGSASQQNSGVINTYNTTNDTSSMLDLIDKLLASLPEIQGVDAEEIENVKDDLEMVQEQLKTDNPKKNRIGKALVGIKKFAGDFSMKLAVTLAAGAVTGADGKFERSGLGSDGKCKEATNTAFNFLKANSNRISGSISTTTKDYIINYQDLQGIGMTDKLALPTLIALSSVALGKPVASSLAVLGEISIAGTLIKVDELANSLQVCLDSGAKKVLLPIVSAADIGAVPSDLIGCFNLIFYSSAEDAVYKALGVE